MLLCYYIKIESYMIYQNFKQEMKIKKIQQ